LERLSTFLLENEIFSLRIPSEAQELDRASLFGHRFGQLRERMRVP
jgi:hypothetical protein